MDEILSVLLPSYGLNGTSANSNPAPQRPRESPAPSLIGNWVGRIQTYKGDLPLTFSITESGDVQAKLGSAASLLLKNARFGSRLGKQSLTGGLTASDLGTDEDTGPDPYDLDFELYLQDRKLYGAVTTRTRSGARYSARLSYWVELEKQAVQSSGPLQR